MQATGPTLDELREPADPDARAVVARYQAAFEAADVPALTRLLAHDVVLEMPPVALWLTGRSPYHQFMERVFAIRGSGWRLAPVHANGSPALAAYAPNPTTGRISAHSLNVFDVADGLIRRCVTFADPAVFSLFTRSTTPPAEAAGSDPTR